MPSKLWISRRITEVIIFYTSSQSPFEGGKVVKDWSPNHYIPLLRRVFNVAITVVIPDNDSSVDCIYTTDDDVRQIFLFC